MKSNVHFLQNEKGLLWLIIIVGVILRFYNAFEIPFTHDELSAYYRLQFDSFGELIEKGVKVDGHPALIHVFLYYWSNAFGYTEFITKLPFLILGVASISLSYTVTKKWFNSTSALLVAAFMASLQFPIMFSQIARPYISGLFLILLLVHFWTDFLFTDKNKTRALIGMVLAASLSSYNHYFSLMLAGIIGLTGLFFLNKETKKMYLIGLASVVILFLPHFQIFLYQFSGQGLDWLGKPTGSFFLEHIQFIFHFSFWVYFVVVFLLGFGISQTRSWELSKFQWISLTWFWLPILIGVGYSIFVKPVVQYSMLLFSFPFLLVFLFSFIKPISSKLQTIVVILILSVNISSLIWEREYYKVFYHQPFEQFSSITHQFTEGEFTDEKPSDFETILNNDPRYLNFYFKNENPNTSFQSIFKQDVNPIEFKAETKRSNSNYLLLGNVPNHLVMIAQESFPNLVYEENGFNYTFIILGKEPTSRKQNTYFSSILDFEKENHDWPNYRRQLDWDNYIIKLDSTQEYGPLLELELDQVIPTRHALIQLKLDFKTSHLENGLLVVSVVKNGTEVSWNSISLDEFTDTTRFDNWQRAYFSVDLTSSFKNSSEISGATLRINYWNNKKQSIAIDNFQVEILEGNRYIYGTIQPID